LTIEADWISDDFLIRDLLAYLPDIQEQLFRQIGENGGWDYNESLPLLIQEL
jgi:hypothetical protein